MKHEFKFLFIVVFSLASITIGCRSDTGKKELGLVYYDLGNAYNELGKTQEAIQAYEKALENDPELLKASYNLVRVRIARKEYAKAYELLDQLRGKESNNIILLETEAWLDYLTGDTDKSLELYSSILEQDPYHYNALYNLGLISYELDDWPATTEYFVRCLNINANNIDAEVFRYLGESSLQNGDDDGALSFFSRYLQNKKDPEIQEKILSIYLKKKMYTEALEILESLSMDFPDNATYKYKKAYILLTATEDLERGLAALKSAVDIVYDEKEINSILSQKDLLFRDDIQNYLKSFEIKE